MTDSTQRMSEREAIAIVGELGEIVRSPRAERIMAGFSALAALDAYWIERRANTVIAGLDPDLLDDGGMGAAGLLHRATMDTFRASLFECVEDKCPDIEPSVEHDIPTWIEANAPFVISANIRIMEAALPADDPQAHRSLIEFHQLVDLDACEAEQARVLLEVWSDIEAKIRARLALPESV
ncbi:MAG: hypothetical protein EOM91_24290 [Sphingobacteriia bacterium]|jgi:hypothetical protein|nr:hypothetical protein [Sphingobacteriia bacterium]